MTLTSAQKVRLKIADAPRWIDVTRYGDGTAVTHGLSPHYNIANGTAYVPLGGTAWSATGATFNASGYIAFSGVISANSAFRLTYDYATFSDSEIDQFLSDGGSVVGAAIQALDSLMFDATRAARWMAADGTSYDNTSTQSHLRQMRALLIEQLQMETTVDGSMTSWSVNQELY